MDKEEILQLLKDSLSIKIEKIQDYGNDYYYRPQKIRISLMLNGEEIDYSDIGKNDIEWATIGEFEGDSKNWW